MLNIARPHAVPTRSAYSGGTTEEAGETPAPLRRLILAEQVFQVGLGKAAGEAFFAEHVGDGLGFALLQFPNFFLDGAGGDQPVGVDRAGLADAMVAVDGLGFHRRVPPWALATCRTRA